MHCHLFIRTPFLTPFLHSLLLGMPVQSLKTSNSPVDQLIALLVKVFKDCTGVLYKKLSMNLLFLINNLTSEPALQFVVYAFLIALHNATPSTLATNKTIFKEIQTAGKKNVFSPLIQFLLYYALLLSTDQQASMSLGRTSS